MTNTNFRSSRNDLIFYNLPLICKLGYTLEYKCKLGYKSRAFCIYAGMIFFVMIVLQSRKNKMKFSKTSGREINE